jgi:hypothetical protein
MPSQEKLTADAFDPPPDTEQSSACQEPSVNPALFWHGRHPSVIERAVEQGGEWDGADGKVHKRHIESRVRRCQQEAKYTPRVGEVGQSHSERKPNCAAERDCLARIYTQARGGEGRYESCYATGQKSAAVSAERRVPW